MKTTIKNLTATAKKATYIFATKNANGEYEYFYSTNSVKTMWNVLSQYKEDEIAVFHKSEIR